MLLVIHHFTVLKLLAVNLPVTS